MDFKNLLQSLDQLNEGITATKQGGKIHTAEPGGYGRKDDEDEEGNRVKQDTAPRGRGRPKKDADETGEVKKYDFSAFGVQHGKDVKLPKYDKKKTTKHSLKDWIETVDEQNMIAEAGLQPAAPGKNFDPQTGKPLPGRALNAVRAKSQYNSGALGQVRQNMANGQQQVGEEELEEAGLAVQPIPAPKQASGQNFMIKDPANPTASAITTSDPAVVKAAKDGTLSMQKPGASSSATPATGAGSQVGAMQEGELDEKIEGGVKLNPEKKGMFNGKSKSELMSQYNKLKASGPHKKGSPENTKMHELAFAIRAKSGWGKVKEAEAPQHYAQSSPMSNGGRSDTFLESADKKKMPSMAHIKKMCADGKSVTEICKMHPDCDHKELKKLVADCKKKMIKESMNHKLKAAHHAGKSHALSKQAYNCHYDDMDEASCYHEGYKEGLDECYGQMPILGRTRVGEMGPGAEVDNMASFGARTPELDEIDKTAYMQKKAKETLGDTFKAFGQTMHDKDVLENSLAFEALDSKLNALLSEGLSVSISKGQQGSPDSVSVNAQDGEADMLLNIIKQAGLGVFGGEEKAMVDTPNGSHEIGGIEVVDDHDGMMSLMKRLSGQDTHSHDYEDEIHDHEDETCNECGMTYESCGCDHGDKEMVDEVESEDQMAYKVAEDEMEEDNGGAQNPPDNGSANSMNATKGNNAANTALAIADKKGPIAEEGEEDEGMFGRSKNDKRYLDKFDPTNVMNISDNPGMKAHKTTGKGSLRTSREDLEFAFGPPGKDDTWVLEFTNGLIATIYPQSNSGGMDWIIGGNHPDTEDFVHMAYSAALDDELEEDTTGEDDEKDFFHNPNVPADKQLKAPPKEVNVAESFANLYKKLAWLSEESTSEKDDKAEKAGKKVAKDIEYDEGHKGKDDDKAEKAGKKVKKDIEYDDKKDKKLDEWANDAGPGKTVTDTTFEQDIEFMTKIISGGLNKPKSTGQTTVPVIAGQASRMGVNVKESKQLNESVSDWKKLAGI